MEKLHERADEQGLSLPAHAAMLLIRLWPSGLRILFAHAVGYGCTPCLCPVYISFSDGAYCFSNGGAMAAMFDYLGLDNIHHLFCNIGGMVCDSFQVARNKYEMNGPCYVRGVLHHIGQ